MAARPNIKGVRDATTMALLRETYSPGTKVEAVKVRDVPTGMNGIVREVQSNGDISILWINGETINVEYGTDSVKVINDTKCMLKRKKDGSECEGKKCAECGWNEKVHKERVEKIRAGAMVKRKTKHGIVRVFEVEKEESFSNEQELLKSNA